MDLQFNSTIFTTQFYFLTLCLCLYLRFFQQQGKWWCSADEKNSASYCFFVGPPLCTLSYTERWNLNNTGLMCFVAEHSNRFMEKCQPGLLKLKVCNLDTYNVLIKYFPKSWNYELFFMKFFLLFLIKIYISLSQSKLLPGCETKQTKFCDFFL